MPLKKSKEWLALKKTLHQAPRVVGPTFTALEKASAEATLKSLKNHLKREDLGLKRLKPATIEAKVRAGLDTRILMATGEDSSRSMINLIEVKKRGKNFVVGPSKTKKHHSGLSAEAIWEIHTAGAVIDNGVSVIRIHKRDAVGKTVKLMSSRIKKASEKVVRSFLQGLLVKKKITATERRAMVKMGLKELGRKSRL